jgi:selenocysteine-specific elongation factor
LDIEKVLVAVTYADLARGDKLNAVRESIRIMLSDSRYANAPIVTVSSITGLGLPELKNALLSLLSPPSRDVTGKFKMVIDHSFPIKGTGTVITGTIVRGKTRIGDKIEISPINVSCRVKSIQTFKEPREEAQAGDRVGIALQGIDYRSIYRGYYASSPESLATTNHILAKAKLNKFFKHEITPGLLMHTTVGMSSIQTKVFPYQLDESGKAVVTPVRGGKEFTSYVKMSKPVVAEKGDRILFSLISLPPTSLRIAAGGTVSEVLTGPPSLVVIEEKAGVVSRVTKNAVIVGGLASSKIGAERMIGESILTDNGGKGTISSAFGSKGFVVSEFDKRPAPGAKVSLRRYREFNIS